MQNKYTIFSTVNFLFVPIERDELQQVLDIRILGFDTAQNNVRTLIQDFKLLEQAKKAAVSAGGQVVDPALIDRFNRSLADFKKGQSDSNDQTDRTASTIVKLSDNLKAAETVIASFNSSLDTNTEKFKLATDQAALYAAELDRIVAALKSVGGSLPTLPTNTNRPAPASTQQTAEQVREVAQAYALEGENVLAAGNAFQEFAAAAGTAVIPLQEQTGTLSRNIALYNLNKTAIADVRAQMSQLTTSTSAADRQGAAYQSRIAQLTGQERQLLQTNKDLNTTINAQLRYTQAAAGSLDQLRAELVLARIAYDGLSDEVKKSDLGKGLLSNIQTLNTQVTAAEGVTGRFQRNVGNYASVAFGYVRTLANILPGIGISGIVLAVSEGIQTIIENFKGGTKAINTFAENLKNFNEVSQNANKNIAEQATQLKILFEAATTGKDMDQRLRAVEALQKLFPEYFGNLTQEQILNGKVGDSYKNLTQNIIDNAKAVAANAKIVEIESKILDAEDQKSKIRLATYNLNLRQRGTTSVVQGVTISTTAEEEKKVNLIRAQAAIDVENKKIASYVSQENFLKQFAGQTNLINATIDKTIGKQKAGLEELEAQLKKVYQQISVTAKTDPIYQVF